MTKEHNDKEEIREPGFAPGRISKFIFGVLLAVALGAIGSGIWEVIFRPSLNQAGSLVTRISQQADNAVFTTAALDPVPIPALFTLLLLAHIPMFVAVFMLLDALLGHRVTDAIERWHKKTVQQKGVVVAKRRRRKVRRLVGLIGALYFIALYVVSYAGFSILNEAVLVSRIFHRNVAICLPMLSNEQQSLLLSQFASMKSRVDFESIVERLDKYAKEGNVQLQWYKKKS